MIEKLSMAKVRQYLPRPRVEDIPTEIIRQIERLTHVVRPGMSVAITAGSRGISGITTILRTAVKTLQGMGTKPFVVAAMGSHGGGTVIGQQAILNHFGITSEAIGAPIRVTTKAVEVGRTSNGYSVYVDAEATRADAILLLNRIKPHTAFQDKIGSGLLKMLTVGLGKEPGATQVHKLGSSGIYSAILEMAEMALQKLPMLGGLGIVENAYEETAKVELLLPEEMEDRERKLFHLATSLLPGLPVQELDLLIVEEMGKNYSGTGMDTNVIGRWKATGFPEPEHPHIKRIVVLRLAGASEGNANGIGLADFTTQKLVKSIDWKATLTNIRTTGFWARGFCPPFLDNDLEAIEWALESLKLPPEVPISAARIRNTLHLDELWLSPKALAAAKGCEQIGPFKPFTFSPEGDLLSAE